MGSIKLIELSKGNKKEELLSRIVLNAHCLQMVPLPNLTEGKLQEVFRSRSPPLFLPPQNTLGLTISASM